VKRSRNLGGRGIREIKKMGNRCKTLLAIKLFGIIKANLNIGIKNKKQN